ncbi:MAG: methyl-accepting chemotaxis protein [Myxococcales bacterium]
MMLNNLKVSWRLTLGFGALIVVMALATTFTIVNLGRIEDATHNLESESRLMALIGDMVRDIDGIVIHVGALLTQHEPARRKVALTAIAEQHRKVASAMEDVRKLLYKEHGRELLRKCEDAVTALRAADAEAADLAMAGRDAEAFAQFDDRVLPANAKVEEAVDAFLAFRHEMQASQEKIALENISAARFSASLGGVLVFLFAIVAGFVISRSVSRPVNAFVQVVDQLSKGDLTVEIEAEALARKDEMGDLSRAAQAMVDNLRRMVGDISTGVQTLAASSTELSTIASQTTGGAQTMRSRATTVAAAAEEASANTLSVAAGMKQASTSLSTVANATEQMSAAIAEVAHNAAKARTISEQATAQGQVVTTTMKELGDAARQIGKVTETITDISSQTNLLALNATIEAARAGAAGKGFAVVANEIKELARQTAAATEDIKTKISGVQSSTGGAIADIEKITGVVQDVGGLVSSIAASIEEQAAVTKDVARNISQATTGVSDSNCRVEQTATVSKTIAQDIAGVNSAAVEIDQGGAQVAASAASLSKLAEQLRGLTAQFKM